MHFIVHILDIHPAPVKAVVEFNPQVRMSTQDFPHHVIHVDVGQDGSFNRDLANATGDFEPWAKLVFGTNPTTRVRVKVPKEFKKLLGYASFA